MELELLERMTVELDEELLFDEFDDQLLDVLEELEDALLKELNELSELNELLELEENITVLEDERISVLDELEPELELISSSWAKG